MGVWSRLNINFDVEPGEFELLERESGQPRLLGVSDDIPNTSEPQKSRLTHPLRSTLTAYIANFARISIRI